MSLSSRFSLRSSVLSPRAPLLLFWFLLLLLFVVLLLQLLLPLHAMLVVIVLLFFFIHNADFSWGNSSERLLTLCDLVRFWAEPANITHL